MSFAVSSNISISKEADTDVQNPGKLSGLILNGKEYGKDVKEAKKELDLKLEEFKDEAQICAHRRFARMEETGKCTETALHKYGGAVIGKSSPPRSLSR